MNCPYCNRNLHKGEDGIYSHLDYMTECKGRLFDGSKELWQELTKTKQALDAAVGALREYEDRDSYDCNGDWCGCEYSTARKAIDQIKQITETKE